MNTMLYFWNPLLETYKQQLDLVSGYYEKTKFIFDDIEEQAEILAEKFYDEFPSNSDTDPATVADYAHSYKIDMVEDLWIMKSNHLLLTILMLYVNWEQQLVKFIKNSLSRQLRINIKSIEYGLVEKIFKYHEVPIAETKAWENIRELKSLSNTIKHGSGVSFEKLKKIRPDFFSNNLSSDKDLSDQNETSLLLAHSIFVEEIDFYKYVNATKQFWDEMPEFAYCDLKKLLDLLYDDDNKNKIF